MSTKNLVIIGAVLLLFIGIIRIVEKSCTPNIQPSSTESVLWFAE